VRRFKAANRACNDSRGSIAAGAMVSAGGAGVLEALLFTGAAGRAAGGGDGVADGARAADGFAGATKNPEFALGDSTFERMEDKGGGVTIVTSLTWIMDRNYSTFDDLSLNYRDFMIIDIGDRCSTVILIVWSSSR